MDPITAIGLLASISNLICASGEAAQILHSFKDGEKELSGLASQVVLFEENLKGFHRIFRSQQVIHRISIQTLTQIIDESAAELEELKGRLRLILKSENSTIRRVKWIQHKAGLERINGLIKGKCAMLHGLVSVAQTYGHPTFSAIIVDEYREMMMAMCNQDPRLLDACSTVASEMGMPRKEGTIPNPASQPIPQLQMPDDALPPAYHSSGSQPSSSRPISDTSFLSPQWRSSRDSMSSLHPPGAGSVSDIWTTSSRSSSPGGSVFSSHSAASSSILVPDIEQSDELPKPSSAPSDSLVIRRACRFDCYCKCHTQSITVTSEVFSRFNTPVFPPDKGAKVECSEPDCAGATSAKRMSSMLLHRAMSRLLSLQGPRTGRHLNMYRMVPEGSAPLRYVKHGNLDRLKLSMTRREATPWDTAPDGWSLLHVSFPKANEHIVNNIPDCCIRPPTPGCQVSL